MKLGGSGEGVFRASEFAHKQSWGRTVTGSTSPLRFACEHCCNIGWLIWRMVISRTKLRKAAEASRCTSSSATSRQVVPVIKIRSLVPFGVISNRLHPIKIFLFLALAACNGAPNGAMARSETLNDTDLRPNDETILIAYQNWANRLCASLIDVCDDGAYVHRSSLSVHNISCKMTDSHTSYCQFTIRHGHNYHCDALFETTKEAGSATSSWKIKVRRVPVGPPEFILNCVNS